MYKSIVQKTLEEIPVYPLNFQIIKETRSPEEQS
jgi:hypothetical protein